MTNNPIKTKWRGSVLEVTLDHPKANTIDLETSRIISEVFSDFRMKFQDAMNKITKSQFATLEKLYRFDDQLKAAHNFTQKRAPVWKGKQTCHCQ